MVLNMKKSSAIIFVNAFFWGGLCGANADTFAFVASSHTYATATVTASSGSNALYLTLTNNMKNQQDVGQAISAIGFNITSNGKIIKSATITSQSGRMVSSIGGSTSFQDIGSNGNTSDSLSWGVGSNKLSSTASDKTEIKPGAITISTLDFKGAGEKNPGETIWGTPTSSTSNLVIYANANPSMTGASHQPGIVQSADFTLQLSNALVPGFSITNVVMYFGTSGIPEFMISPPPLITPEPSMLVLLSFGFPIIGIIAYRQKTAV
jgi:hypothetical protein